MHIYFFSCRRLGENCNKQNDSSVVKSLMKIVISAAFLNLDPENALFNFYDSNTI